MNKWICRFYTIVLAAVLAVPIASHAGAAAWGAKPKKKKKVDTADAAEKDPDKIEVRNTFVIREIKFASDWNTDPTAVPQFMSQMGKRTGEPTKFKSLPDPVEFADKELFRWPLVYMTAHNGFEFTPNERKNLRRYVLNGGVIWADDCLPGSSTFMQNFNSEMDKIFPKHKLEDISKEDPRFASMYWLFYPIEKEPGCIHAPAIPNRVMMIDGQIAIIITMNDYGCAWEVSIPPDIANPIGWGMHGWQNNQRVKAYEFSSNLVYYLLTH